MYSEKLLCTCKIQTDFFGHIFAFPMNFSFPPLLYQDLKTFSVKDFIKKTPIKEDMGFFHLKSDDDDNI